MNNKTLYVLLVVLVGLNIFLVSSFSNYKKNKVFYESYLINNQESLEMLKSNLSANIANEGLSLESIMVKDTSKHEFPLDTFFISGQSHLLVCRFSDAHCESCVHNAVRTLLKQVGRHATTRVLFLGSYRKTSLLKIQMKDYGIEAMRVANVKSLNIPAESVGFPYYFLIDSSLHVKQLFFPDKVAQSINRKYLSDIQKKYW